MTAQDPISQPLLTIAAGANRPQAVQAASSAPAAESARIDSIVRASRLSQHPFRDVEAEVEAPFSRAEAPLTPPVPATMYELGLEGEPRPVGYGENSWLSSIIIATLILLAFNINHCRRLFRNFPEDLLGMRERSNAFDERPSNDVPSSFLIILLLCLTEGILLFTMSVEGSPAMDVAGSFGLTMTFSALALCFFLAQLIAYSVLGYAFADHAATTAWLRGFVASQSLLAFLLLIPALVALFYPSSLGAMLMVAGCAYFLCRMLFICKGFRIFYTNPSSLLYFILYLCALEITPLILLRQVAFGMLEQY